MTPDTQRTSRGFSWLNFGKQLTVFALQMTAGAGAAAASTPLDSLAPRTPNRRLLEPAPHNPHGRALQQARTFTQPLWHGEDTRIEHSGSSYYSVWRLGNTRLLYKHASLIDRGVGKELPFGFPLFAPKFIKTLNGDTYNQWVAIGTDSLSQTPENPDNSLSLWVNPADPYDNIEQWSQVRNLPQVFKAWSIDFELFENPQAGAYQGGLYLAWAGAESPSTGWHPENVYVAKVLSLRSGETSLSTYDSVDANKVAGYRYDWSDVVKEGPGTWINPADQTLCLGYSGNGADTVNYAVGYTCLKRGQDPAVGGNWFDHNGGGDDAHKDAPELTGPNGFGVVRFVPSPDGQQTWAMAHSKTFTAGPDETPNGDQDSNLDYYRHIVAMPVSTFKVTAQGQSYTLPSMAPAAQNDVLALPSGDVGPRSGARRIEAEEMNAYGLATGPTVRGLARSPGFSAPFGTVPPGAPAPNITADGLDTDVLTQCGLAWSGSAYVTHVDALAADLPGVPKKAGLYTTNVPAATRLTVASASAQAANLDLTVNGAVAQTLRLPATGGPTQFVRTGFAVNIPANAVLGLSYEAGRSVAANIDYLDLEP